MVIDRASIWQSVLYSRTRIFGTLIWAAAAKSSKSISYANVCHLGAVVWYPQTWGKPLASDRKRRKRQKKFPCDVFKWKWSNCDFQDQSLRLEWGICWFYLGLKDTFESNSHETHQKQVLAELSLNFFPLWNNTRRYIENCLSIFCPYRENHWDLIVLYCRMGMKCVFAYFSVLA